MPFYDYKTEDGKVVELMLPIKEAKAEIVLEDGRRAKKMITTCSATGIDGQGWPLYCKSSAVHPSQGRQLAEYLKSKGVPTDVNKLGQPKYENSNHQARALKARGLANMDGIKG